MRVVVFGAAGPTGELLVRQALAWGLEVVAVTRRAGAYPLSHDHLTVARADATDPSQVEAAVAGADAVVSVLGTRYSRGPITLYSTSARAIIAAMSRHGVRRLVATSSSAANPWVDPGWSWIERNVARRILDRLGATLYEDMRRMEQIVRASNLEWTIMRPLGLANMEAPTQYAVRVDHIAGKQTARRDLASAILDELATTAPDAQAHVGKCVAVATTNKTVSLPATIWREGIRPKLPARFRAQH
ncbi:NAD(P)H-binding protein [Actinomyces radicidentis]|uniref:NAD(P)H-binding protein n=1 Tax=Actinomyces radicidentis TaxID=111015 RepID=UPI0028EECA89|nr:NAD(P)H-binding protein [Actinomyces radicidentis]